MTCRQLKFDLIDFARGVALHPARDAEIQSHLRSCESCTARVERQRAMSVALRRLARQRTVPPANSRELNSLLTAFDRPRARSRRATIAVGLSLAASVLIVVSLSVGLERGVAPSAPQAVAATLAPPMRADSAFVVLPGATALIAAGLSAPAHGGAVQADVLVGQDGLARALRVVQ
jgi:anti-sigma factor RsiW